MVIDWSATAAWIALIVAIISPIANTLIQGFLDFRKMRFLQETVKKRDVYSQYLSATPKYLGNTTYENLEAYYVALGSISLYLSAHELELIERLDEQICNDETAARNIFYQEVIPALQKSYSLQKKNKTK